jgi:hypothetical protein
MQFDLETILTYVFAAMGAAGAIVAALNAAIVPLREWANGTANETDNAIVEAVARFLAVASKVLLVLGQVVAVVAARNPKKVFPPAKADK